MSDDVSDGAAAPFPYQDAAADVAACHVEVASYAAAHRHVGPVARTSAGAGYRLVGQCQRRSAAGDGGRRRTAALPRIAARRPGGRRVARFCVLPGPIRRADGARTRLTAHSRVAAVVVQVFDYVGDCAALVDGEAGIVAGLDADRVALHVTRDRRRRMSAALRTGLADLHADFVARLRGSGALDAAARAGIAAGNGRR